MIPPVSPAHRRSFALLAGVALLYLLAANVGLRFAVVGSTVTLVWPPSGIALVALLTFGQRYAFSIAGGAFLANALTDLPLPLSAAIAVGNTLEASVGAWLLQRVAGFQCTMNRRRDVFALIGGAATLSTMISAAIGVTTLAWGGQLAQHDYESVLLKWWLGDMMGVLVVAPLLLVLLCRPFPRLSPARAGEALALLATLTLFSHQIFGTSELAGHGYYPAALAILPFVIWGALRFDHWGASLTTLLVSVLAIVGTTQGTGPFAAVSAVDSLVR
jgi:two-component system, NarL family, sensor histidine kinase FusK